MPMFTQILVSLAAIIVIAEFCLVLKVKRDRKIWENLNNRKEQ